MTPRQERVLRFLAKHGASGSLVIALTLELTAHQVAAVLVQLGGEGLVTSPTARGPLGRRTRHWVLTSAGVDALRAEKAESPVLPL